MTIVAEDSEIRNSSWTKLLIGQLFICSRVTESRHFLDWSFAVYLMIHISFGDLNSTATMFAGISCIWWLLFTEPPLRITVFR